MVSTSILILQILHGLVFGMILLLLSLGFSLMFGIAGVVNFAHGALYAVGAFTTAIITAEFGSPVLGLVVAFVFVSLLGGAMEIGILRPLYDRDPLFQLLATFGVVFIIEGTLVNVLGTVARQVPVPDLVQGPIPLGPILYPKYRIVLVVVTAILTAIVWLLLENTEYGVRLRAATYSSEMVDALGTDTNKLFTGTVMFGSGLAAIAGGLAAPLFTATTDMGAQMIILVFIVVVVGGLGSFRGAIIGSFIIGESLTLGQVFFEGYASMMPYLAMLVILLARPRGLLGQEMEL